MKTEKSESDDIYHKHKKILRDWSCRALSFVETAFPSSEMSQEESLETINQGSS